MKRAKTATSYRIRTQGERPITDKREATRSTPVPTVVNSCQQSRSIGATSARYLHGFEFTRKGPADVKTFISAPDADRQAP